MRTPQAEIPPAIHSPPWPTVLRFSGLWLIWAAWASLCGWLLSLAGALGGTGYLISLPVLLIAWFQWWKHTRPGDGNARLRFGIRRPRTGSGWLKACFTIVAGLSLVAALIHIPWSYDAATYRLPRCLYWLAESRWYWIGTLDGRLDYSSCGLEWQMIPLMLLTKTDRFLFLLAFIPFLLLPGLLYLGGRALGFSRRPVLIWMWLLPCAYCIALQCSGLQNDGYTASYTAACLAFGGVAISRRSVSACMLAGLSAALLTGAKLSNMPLMLPLGIVFLLAAWRSGFFRSAAVTSLPLMALVSFLPLAVLSIHYTGQWTGDPHDQWGFRTGNPVAAVIANLILSGNDLAHPPVMVGTDAVNNAVKKVEGSVKPFMDWLAQSHRMFRGIGFGDLSYEGVAGPGFALGIFLAGGILIGFFVKVRKRSPQLGPWPKVVLASGVIAWVVLLSQLGSSHSARNTAPYLPLLLPACAILPPLRRFFHTKSAVPLAMVGILSVIPVIILTPARPLIPLTLLEMAKSVGPVSKILEKYRMWVGLRDDLAPMREQLPQDEAIIGYAGAFKDTSYGLWKPFGSRTIQEIEIPIAMPARPHPLPGFVVATSRGIQQRCGQSIDEWMRREHKEIHYSFKRSLSLEANDGGGTEEWYLLGPKQEAR